MIEDAYKTSQSIPRLISQDQTRSQQQHRARNRGTTDMQHTMQSTPSASQAELESMANNARFLQLKTQATLKSMNEFKHDAGELHMEINRLQNNLSLDTDVCHTKVMSYCKYVMSQLNEYQDENRRNTKKLDLQADVLDGHVNEMINLYGDCTGRVAELENIVGYRKLNF